MDFGLWSVFFFWFVIPHPMGSKLYVRDSQPNIARSSICNTLSYRVANL